MGRGALRAGAVAVVVAVAVAILFFARSRDSGSPRPQEAAPAPAPAAAQAPAAGPDANTPPRVDGKAPAVDVGPRQRIDKRPMSDVSGTVVDSTGRPAPGVVVWCRESGKPAILGETDEAGRWSCPLPEGEQVVHARGEGTGTAKGKVTVPSDESPVAAPTLHLPDGLRITGRVLDREGKPLVAVRVRAVAEEGETLEYMEGGRRLLIGTDDVVTDADGNFALRGLEDAPHHVTLDLKMTPKLRSDPAYRSGVRPGGEPIEFRAVGAARIRGAVVDGETGDPVPTFTVEGTLFDRADGKFEAELGDDPDIEIASPGYVSRKLPGAEFGDGELEIALEPALESGVLVLKVSGIGGEPIAGLRAQGVTSEFRTWLCTWKEPAQEFRVGRTAAGGQTVFLQAEGWTPVSIQVDVPAGGQARPEVKLQRCGSARVRILDAKGNVLKAGAQTVLFDAEGKGPAVRWVYARPQGTTFVITEFQLSGNPEGTTLALAEADGTLTGLIPGTYKLRVGIGEKPKEAVFAVVAGETVEVTIRLGE